MSTIKSKEDAAYQVNDDDLIPLVNNPGTVGKSVNPVQLLNVMNLPSILVSPSGASDTVNLQAAMDSISADGGGNLLLSQNGIYSVPTPVSLKAGVKVKGGGYSTSNATFLTGGTRMQGDGTGSCFVYNQADTIAPLTSNEMYAESLYGSGLLDMAFTNFVTPVKIGALEASGAFYSEFRNLFATNCTGWGFYFENCSLSNFTNLTVRNMAAGATGGMMFRSSHTVYNHGNSSYRYLFAEPDKDLTRGIVVQARNGSTFNDNNFFHVQCNTGGTFQSSVSSTVNASANITLGVGDGALFPLDMPVSVVASVAGFITLQTYFVVSQVGDVIQLAHLQGDAANAITATATGAITIITHGFPGVEVCGYGPTNTGGVIQPTVMTGIDIESSATCGMLWQNARIIADFSLVPSDQGVTSGDVCCSSVVFRGDAVGTYRSLSTFFAVDIQQHYKALYNLGTKVNLNTYPNSIVQAAPLGMYYDGGNSQSYLTLAGNLMGGNYSLKTITAQSGSFIYPNQTLGQRCTDRSNGATPYNLTWFSAGAIVYTGTTAVTWTLPALTDGDGGTGTSSAGIPYEICNGSANPVAITLDANTGDNFNNQAAKTSVTLDQGDSISVRANYNGVNSFWQIIGEHDASASLL